MTENERNQITAICAEVLDKEAGGVRLETIKRNDRKGRK